MLFIGKNNRQISNEMRDYLKYYMTREKKFFIVEQNKIAETLNFFRKIDIPKGFYLFGWVDKDGNFINFQCPFLFGEKNKNRFEIIPNADPSHSGYISQLLNYQTSYNKDLQTIYSRYTNLVEEKLNGQSPISDELKRKLLDVENIQNFLKSKGSFDEDEKIIFENPALLISQQEIAVDYYGFVKFNYGQHDDKVILDVPDSRINNQRINNNQKYTLELLINYTHCSQMEYNMQLNETSSFKEDFLTQ